MYSGNNIISAIQSCAAYEHRERVSLNLTRETRANRSTLRVSSFPLYIYIYQLTTIYSMEKQLEDESRIRREEESVGIGGFPDRSISSSNSRSIEMVKTARSRLLPGWEARLWGRAPCQIFMAISRASAEAPTIF